jgi:hypothetical protein
MPHEIRDANIDLYLKSLSDYSDQYGGGKYQIRAAGQGAGYGFVNPQTDNFFDIPTQQSAITAAGGEVNAPAAGSFDEYIQQIGGHKQEMSIPRTALGPVDIGREDNQWQEMLAGATYNENPYSIGQHVPEFTRSQQFYRDQNQGRYPNRIWTDYKDNYWNELGPSRAGGKFKQGYTDEQGGFIGWEGDMQRRYQDQLINSMRNVQGV